LVMSAVNWLHSSHLFCSWSSSTSFWERYLVALAWYMLR